MPGIIVSRPIFNTLFRLAHEQGLSINAFLTKLLENSSSDATSQAAAGAGAAAGPAEQPVDGVEHGGSVNGPVLPEPELAQQQPGRSAGAPPQPVESFQPDRPGRGVSQPVGGVGRGMSEEEADDLWEKVSALAGRKLATSRGKKFTFRVNGEYVVVRESSARIPKSQFHKAEKMWPVRGPSQLVGVYAPSIVWAVMNHVSSEAGAVPELAD